MATENTCSEAPHPFFGFRLQRIYLGHISLQVEGCLQARTAQQPERLTAFLRRCGA